MPRRVLILGCGSVVQCLLPLLLDHFTFEPSSITILESRDNRERIVGSIERGVHYRQFEINRENLEATLGAYLSDGDLRVAFGDVNSADLEQL